LDPIFLRSRFRSGFGAREISPRGRRGEISRLNPAPSAPKIGGIPVITPELAEQILLTAGAGMLGTSIGSFVNVCIYRWPRDLSVAAPKRSFWPCCKEPIRAFDNIPVLSWLLLGGSAAGAAVRCRYPIFW